MVVQHRCRFYPVIRVINETWFIVMMSGYGFSINRISLGFNLCGSITGANIGSFLIELEVRSCSFNADQGSGRSQQTIPFCEN